jgi:PEP-CTERM motif.
MKTFARSNLAAGLSLAALALAWTPVHADVISFDLTTANAAVFPPYAGPYATVTINLTSGTSATITFDSLSSGGNIYDFGGNGAVAVNVNASSWTLGTLTATNTGTGFTPGPLSDGGSNNENGFGNFNQTIDSFDGYSHSSTEISFVLTNTSGGTWADAAAVLIANDATHDAVAAAHIFVCAGTLTATTGCDASATALVTGYAAGSGGTTPPTEIPEPDSSSLALLALGLLGAGFWPRRKA